MEKVMNILKPKPNPQQLLRDWQRRLRQECRNIERQIRDIQREEKSVQKAIRDAAKRNDMGSAKALAKEIVGSRRTVNHLYENKAQLNSISMHLGESVAIARTVGHLSKSAEVMKLVNNLMKAPEMAVTMQEFSKEMTKAGVIEELVNDAVDNALDSEDIEDEIEEEVDKVLTAIAGETAAQLPEAARKEKAKLPAQTVGATGEEEAIAEGVDDEEEMEEIRARLAKPLSNLQTQTMASSSNLCKISLSLLLLIYVSSLTAASYPSNHVSSTPYLPKMQAEKLIRSLNLFPKDSVNTQVGDSSLVPGKIVEKKFTFPNLGASGPSVEELGHHAGYYSLPHTKAARMFYLFFESRSSKDDPVVIWLTGGPGCSSELAMFYENGPFHITGNLSLSWNDYGWDKVSNLLYVDQPTGTGFSYTSDESDLRHDEQGVSNDLYDFLQEFFKQHHQFAKNGFYITGESYAGHYIPALASRVYQGNKEKREIHINLKGFAIGNGLTNPSIQYQAYADYALDKSLINKADHDRINKLIPRCEQAIKACGTGGEDACLSAYSACNEIFQQILSTAGNINYYDVRKKCEGSLCYDFSKMETFLNEKAVRGALGVGDLEFVSCSSEVYEAMLTDWMKNLEVGIPALLEAGIKALVYAGEEDLICNWLGNSRWVHAMEWSGQKEFVASRTIPFTVDGAEAGQMKSHGPLTFIKVYEAGHMVPMDQPKAALEMLRSWLQGKPTMTNSGDNVSPK
ncbi:hypothetical protein L6164_019046 [Bauhinia variegata]|uniref:Uncharacterized protein n=1 Tax=Bauhinia variegata TaxID=167791 RepID=A0ACB9ND79_BAUVA|nr:hypothetical protein L6164_019046 [Bauhinia variegata]